MLYLSQLLSVYDGETTTKWGYFFTRNKYGAPFSMEIMEELDKLYTVGILKKDANDYYRLPDGAAQPLVSNLSKSYMFEWRTKYIMTAIDSILTKPFPLVIDAIHHEPGISTMEKINRTSILHADISSGPLFEDFKSIREVISNSQTDLIVPASLWIDCLSIQAQGGSCYD